MSDETLDSFTIEKSIIERRTLVGPYERGKDILADLHADGWRTVRGGPYTDAAMFPKADGSRFLFIVECELEDE